MRKNPIVPRPARKASEGSGKSRDAGSGKALRPAGVVSGQIHGAATKAAAVRLSPRKLIEIIRVGLPVRELDELRLSLDLPMDKLAPRLGISRATLHRRKAQGRLDPEESDRVLRFARLMGRAVEVMEGEEPARRWLTSPQIGLGGAVPLDYAKTEVGAREVEDLLGRIEYGVYS
ncbi:MAG TPA: antitoxin Xre/MbcA/ParS toxin-binding domain-containing protein [Acidobacteriota bacterium]|nr:antitoxin Xre/MbcA/ParS toxin-binding domain-containing protein [Acidobacteriota bacterium]